MYYIGKSDEYPNVNTGGTYVARLVLKSINSYNCNKLFPQLKTVLKGKRFEDIDAIKKNATSTPNTIPKDSFKKCFQQWQDRWKQCVSSQGEYFENY